ncbi:hypothetical protein [Tabrizicola sp.]|uniref:hypothetical protein n=1 Tax=Tabrizicola sp. TaxID=2005166 RepID=UPI00286D50C8|nr:hypothetical protein [Tabrizicola sp.]
MPKFPPTPAEAGQKPLANAKAKPKGFDLSSLKPPKAQQFARLTMKRNLLPGKSGQR